MESFYRLQQVKYQEDLKKIGKGRVISGILEGYPFAIFRTEIGNLCGYVQAVGFEELQFEAGDVDIVCHGGITYDRAGGHAFTEDTSRWIGFDCAHCLDWTPTWKEGTYRDSDYVLLEIWKIIKQLEDLKYGTEQAE